jgi:hypothetical protein
MVTKVTFFRRRTLVKVKITSTKAVLSVGQLKKVQKELTGNLSSDRRNVQTVRQRRRSTSEQWVHQRRN